MDGGLYPPADEDTLWADLIAAAGALVQAARQADLAAVAREDAGLRDLVARAAVAPHDGIIRDALQVCAAATVLAGDALRHAQAQLARGHDHDRQLRRAYGCSQP